MLLQAFGAVGAIETAYYRAAGKQRLFSEQNLIDCSWDIFDVSGALPVSLRFPLCCHLVA